MAERYAGRTAFLVSKPLQLMVSLSLIQQTAWEVKPIIIISGGFAGANEVVGRLLEVFKEVQFSVFFETKKEALSYIQSERFDRVMIDSDIGLLTFIALFKLRVLNQKATFHVYEEGLGTYRTDLYSGLKKRAFEIIGVGTFFGGCVFVSHIHVFRPFEYMGSFPSAAEKVRRLEETIEHFIIRNELKLCQLFGFKPGTLEKRGADYSSCILYLSSWNVDGEFINRLGDIPRDVFIKFHPHIQGAIDDNQYQTVASGIPAELLIVFLARKYDKVHVYDHNSSVRRYIKADNVRFDFARVDALEKVIKIRRKSC